MLREGAEISTPARPRTRSSAPPLRRVQPRRQLLRDEAIGGAKREEALGAVAQGKVHPDQIAAEASLGLLGEPAEGGVAVVELKGQEGPRGLQGPGPKGYGLRVLAGSRRWIRSRAQPTRRVAACSL